METQVQDIKLTQFSHGAGCGCKISPKVLDTILHSEIQYTPSPALLVGNESRDDAAVLDLGDGTAIISTTDFFMPIVDDAYDFGRIASVNAISDIYAMGGTPLLAIAILGLPVDKLPAEVAKRIIEGSRAVCAEAGISLAGGHSIDNPEPVFGLAVTGRMKIEHLKTNSGGVAGCKLFLTKPLGVGVLSTAQKRGILLPEHQHIGRDSMVKLNRAGETFGTLSYIKAMTDVTGFGLLGHLGEMCKGSGLSAEIDFEKVPVIPEAPEYIVQKCIPGGTNRNWDSYGHEVAPVSDFQKFILADPQTSGGLLVAVLPDYEQDFLKVAEGLGLTLSSIGILTEKREKVIYVV